VTLNYQWLRNGSIISGATGTSFLLLAGDVGKDISVQVTGSKIGSSSATRTSFPIFVTVATLTLTPVPTINGTVQIGNTLTANAGVWDSGVSLSYQWIRNGSFISGATGSSYNLTSDDGGKKISVQVTGSKIGWNSVTKTSFSLDGPPIQDMILKTVPTISGGPQVFDTLVAVPGVWDAGVKFSYQWFRNDRRISGETGPSYYLNVADKGQSISVEVTGYKEGFKTVVLRSRALQVALDQTLKPVPEIGGVARIGNTLTVIPGVWDAGVTLSYQWLAKTTSAYVGYLPTAIPGATGATYNLTGVHAGLTVCVQVTGSKSGFNTHRPTTCVSIPVEDLTLGSAPTVIGVGQVGNTLTAVPGVWDAGVTFSYQWLRMGVAIPGATADKYIVTVADAGYGLEVRLTVSKTGYRTATATSTSYTFVPPLALNLTPVPTIRGNAKVGDWLNAVPGVWDSGVTFKYLWLRNGTAIAGATEKEYRVSSSDAGQQISVRVTGDKQSYISVSVTSEAILGTS
jgi:hypothetical protein